MTWSGVLLPHIQAPLGGEAEGRMHRQGGEKMLNAIVINCRLKSGRQLPIYRVFNETTGKRTSPV